MTENGAAPKLQKISLAMIVRDCAADLNHALSTIRSHVDEAVIVDTGSLDNTKEIAAKWDCKISDFAWIDDFSAARNFAFDQCTHDAVLWLDSDDEVLNPGMLLETCRRVILSQADSLFVRYDYEFDEAGHCTTRLWRERVTDRRRFRWRAPIHECQCANWRFQGAYIKPEYGLIRHRRKREDVEAARVRLERNIRILEKTNREGKMETRLLFYWGNTLVGLGRYAEATQIYVKYVESSGVPEERYAAMIAMSECLRQIGDHTKAANVLMQALHQHPNFPTAYLHLSELYSSLKEYRQAEIWARECLLHKPFAEEEMVYNPKAIEARPHVTLAIALANQGRLEEGMPHLRQAEAFYPNDPGVLDVKKQMEAESKRLSLLNSFKSWRTQLETEGHKDRVALLHDVVPDYIRSDGYVQRFAPRKRDPSKKTIVFWCPVQGEAWGPFSIKRGIGGSEEAVINMSREMAKRDWNVEVYAETDEVGEHDGVRWFPINAFGGNEDEVDVAVFWRVGDGPISTGVNAKAVYVWLHDTPVPAQWIPNYDDIIDRVLFLSQFHRSLYPFIKEDHVWYTQNATDPSLWVEPKNKAGSLIYASCPSRGLVYLLRWWNYIRKACPFATLDVYYGWNVWAKNSAKTDPAFGKVYDEIEQTKDQEGITWHGRVGQHELADAFSRSQIWAYPMSFPEISCITAMKAQIMGCLPIVIDKRNAVAETVQHGVKVDVEIEDIVGQKTFMDEVIKHLQNPGLFSPADKQTMVDWAKENFQWAKVASDWDRIMRLDLENHSSSGRHITLERGKTPRRILSATT